MLVRGIALAAAAAAASAATSDVLVYGATPGGIMAALAAANASRTVTLVHPLAHIGGMVTGGLGWTDVGNADAIGGATRAYFELMCEFSRGAAALRAAGSGPCWAGFAPHEAEAAFWALLNATSVTVVVGQTLASVAKAGAALTTVTVVPTAGAVSGDLRSGATTYAAAMFVDASYEGDLLAAAGVSFAFGREANTTYNESFGGRTAPGTGGQ